MAHTYTPPGGHIQTAWGNYVAKKTPIPQSPWQAPAPVGGGPGNTYNLGMPLGNPTQGLVNQKGEALMQQGNGLWRPPAQQPYQTGWNSGQAWGPTQQPHQQWPLGPTAPHNMKRGTLAMMQQQNDWNAQIDDSMNPKSTLADFARQQVQKNVHNPAIQMYAGLPSMAQSATKSDVDANMGLGNRWQEMAQGRNLQNMNVSLSTEPIEQQLQRHGVAAQAGLGQGNLLRQMQGSRDAFGLAKMGHGLRAAQAIYGR